MECIGALCLGGNALRCTPHEVEDFGLRTVQLQVEPRDEATLNLEIYNKRYVGADIKIEEQLYRGFTAYAGASTRPGYKKNFDLELDGTFRGRKRHRLKAVSRPNSIPHQLITHEIYALMGFEMPSFDPTAVWLNGEYLGLYIMQELYDDDYFRGRSLDPISVYKKSSKNIYSSLLNPEVLALEFEVEHGSEDLSDLRAPVELIAQLQPRNVASLEEDFNLDQLLSYMAVTDYTDNLDGISNNFHLIRTETSPRFYFMPWDYEYSLRSGHLDLSRSPERFAPNRLMSLVLGDGSPLRDTYFERLEELNEKVRDAELHETARELGTLLASAWQRDPLLGQLSESLESHAETVELRVQQKVASL